MKALSERQSTREYASKALTLADLSDLLWAANGINPVSYTHLLLTMLVVTGCSDAEEELQSQYGYVQFKLYKSTSFEKGTTTRAVGKLESMSSAQKIKAVSYTHLSELHY